MSTPVGIVFKKGMDYMMAYCRHDGDRVAENLMQASKADLEFIYKEIWTRRKNPNIVIDMLCHGEIGDTNAEKHGVVTFDIWSRGKDSLVRDFECGILTFRANDEVINRSFDEIWDFAYNATGRGIFSDWSYQVFVNFDRDEIATTDYYKAKPKFRRMKKKDFYTRSQSTYYDINKRNCDYENSFSKMGLKGIYDGEDNEYGADGMEEAKKVLSRHGYKVINEVYEDYEMTDDEKDFSTTFKMDFNIADRFGVRAVKDTFRRAFAEWKNDYRYLTDLVIVLNHKIWQYYESNEELARVYNDLWEKARDYAENNLKGHEMEYYFNMTD